MKHMLNTLYVLSEDSYVYKQGETIAVRVGGEERVRVPAHTIDSVICYANTTVSTPLLAFCGERGIGLSFFSPNGKFYGRLEGPVKGNVLLRKTQYRLAEDKESVTLARNIVGAKIANCRNVLLRAARETDVNDTQIALQNAAAEIAVLARQISASNDLETIRGVEGIVANRYFGAFNAMIKFNKDEFYFSSRTRRPPRDRINSLISYLYMMLVNDVRSALEGVGLDPAVGFLHAVRPGRPSLALDLMEEFRAPLCDRMALTLINLRKIQPDDFEITPTSVNISEKARKSIISAWQSRKKDTIKHPFLNETVPIGLLPHVQAQLMARYLRGDVDQYPPFYWR